MTECISPPAIGSLLRDREDKTHPDSSQMVVYELQVRSANACHPEVGSPAQRAACSSKIAPDIVYESEETACSIAESLEEIRLGTLDDLQADSANFREGITLRYLEEKLGVNAIWIMPLFPNNSQWSLPDPCDNLGSPYAVRDYFHASGRISNACISSGRDEYSASPCWGNDALDALLEQAETREQKILLDVALNHFGHNYQYYSLDGRSIAERVERMLAGTNEFDFEAVDGEAKLAPAPLDSLERLQSAARQDAELARDVEAYEFRCGTINSAANLRNFLMFRDSFEAERDAFDCEAGTLEAGIPAFYLRVGGNAPARNEMEMTNAYGWRDVKFLFHHGNLPQYRAEFLRVREFAFDVLNFWVSRGVSGFRLDHATDGYSGFEAAEWNYIFQKLNYYAEKRGQPRPFQLAEEFDNQRPMAEIADALTEGYLFDMTGRGALKDSEHVGQALLKAYRYAGSARVLAALETHDELRLTQETGFDPWVGAGFWWIGASAWSLPMLLAGQEYGESQRLQFRRSHFLPGRFEGSSSYRSDSDVLVENYSKLIELRRSAELNPYLDSQNHRLLTPVIESTGNVVGVAKWTSAGAVFIFHNLWPNSSNGVWAVPNDIAPGIGIDTCKQYQLRDLIRGQVVGTCIDGAAFTRGFTVALGADTRFKVFAFEPCMATDE